MSVAPFAAPLNVDRARAALAELAAGRGELDRFLEGFFGELGKLGDELRERQRSLVAQRQAMEQQLNQQAEELRRQRASLDEQQHRIREQVRQEVAEASAEFAEALVQQRRQMAEERSQWLEELTRMRQLLELMTRREMHLEGK